MTLNGTKLDKDISTAHGQCHCGGVEFSVGLQNGLHTAVRCNCTYCRMRGAVVVFAALGNIEITRGADLLTEYRFHSNAARHWFCSRCGIYTHHQRRFDTGLYAVNVACLDGISPFDFADVPVIDGQNHPKDTGAAEMAVVAHLLTVPVDNPAG